MKREMRQPDDLCLLCCDSKASQKESHIIPKFLGKGLFHDTKPHHSILWHKGGKRQKVQDIIKEDYIFCAKCEKSLSVLETYCALRLERFDNVRYFKDFVLYKEGDFEFVECKDINIKVFNLFIYSVVWRVSISNNIGFSKFKLPDKEEEELRLILKDFLKPTQTDLFSEIERLNILPNHRHVLIRPKKKLRPPTSMLSAASPNEWLNQLHLVDYLMFYITQQDKMIENLRRIDNNRLSGLVRIGLSEQKIWKEFNFAMIKEAIH